MSSFARRFRIALPLLLLAAGLPLLAQVPRTQTRPTKLDLNGTWKDSRNNDVEFTHSGDSVSIKFVKSGRVFSGRVSGHTIDLSHSLTFEETRKNLPMEVRQLITGENVRIHGTISEDDQTIDAEYIDQDPEWEEKDGEYKILKLNEGRTPMRFTRGGYHIAKLNIDYSQWERNHSELRQAVTDTKETLTRREADEQQRQQEWQAEQARVQAREAALAREKAALDAAIERAKAQHPDPRKQSPKYKAAAAKLARNLARQDQIVKRLALLNSKDSPVKAPPGEMHKILDSLIREYEGLQAEETTLRAQIKKMEDDMGFTAEVQRMNEQVYGKEGKGGGLDDIYFEHYKAHMIALNDFDMATKRREWATRDADAARAAYSKALNDWNKFRETDSPRITGVKVVSYYEAEYWTPDEALRQIDPSIKQLDAFLKEMAETKARHRQEFVDASKNAIAKNEKVYSGIIKSAIGQAAVETGFYAYDVIKAGKDGGLFGAAAEAVKKGIEGLVLGPPKFAEPDLNFDVAATALRGTDSIYTSKLSDIPDKVYFKRGVKTTVTGNVTGIVVKKYLVSKAMREFESSWADLMRDTFMETRLGQIDPGFANNWPRLVGQELAAQRGAIAKAEESLAKAKVAGTFRDFGKQLGTKFVVGVVKDLWKEQMKREVANFFESEAMLDFMEADLEARSRALILLRDNRMYWKAHDMHEFLVDSRNEILSQYDPAKQLQESKNESFRRGTTVVIELEDLGKDPGTTTGREAEVLIGGKPARLISAGALRYQVIADDLQEDAQHGVVLQINVQR